MFAAVKVWRAAAIGCALLGAVPRAGAAPAAPGKRGALRPPPHSVSRDNLRRALQRPGGVFAKPNATAADSARFVALRVEFPDLAFGESPPADERHDRFYYQNQFRYVTQYFDRASCGRTGLRVDVPDLVVRAAHPAATYGETAAYDSLIVELTAEAVRGADAAVDFATYDAVLLVHAGPGQESDVAGDSPNQIWSGFLDASTFREQLSTPDSTALGIPTADGVEIRSVVVLPEWQVQDLQATVGTRFGSLGVYAHEIGQRLGMIPLYDAGPPPVPDSQGLGNFDLMAYGLWVANGFIPSMPSAFNRALLGWVDPIEVTGDRDVVLQDAERGPAGAVVLRVPISARESFLVSYVLEDPDGPRADRPCAGGRCADSLVTRRFFDFDNQDASCCFGFEDVDMDGGLSAADRIDSYAGAEWDFFMTDLPGQGTAGGGAGLLVLHVDEQALVETLASGSTNVNGDPQRKAVDVEEADGIQDLDRFPDNPRAFGSADDYFGSGRTFGPRSVPHSSSTNGAPTGIGIRILALPDSTPRTPGGRALVRVSFGASSPSAAAPVPHARRTLRGAFGSDLVGLDLGGGRRGIVVPADSGQVLLVDAALDEAPVSDLDPATLRPWVTVPPAWRGTWIGAPVVGDVDGDAVPDVVLAADVDSAGVPVTRIFAWRRDGTDVRDADGDPFVHSGLYATLPGRGLPPILVADAGIDRIVVAHTDAGGAHVARLGGPLAGCAGVRPRIGGGPIATRVAGMLPAVAWIESDSTGERARLQLATFRGPFEGGCWDLPAGAPPWRMASGDLDGDGVHEVAVVDRRGRLQVVPMTTPDLAGAPVAPRDRATIPAAWVGAPALADLDGDGTLEILVATESAMHVLSFTGAERTGWPYPFARVPGLAHEVDPGRNAGAPLVADLDADGAPEVLLHLAGGACLVWDRNGARRPDLEMALPARAAGTPILDNLDGGLGLELAAIGRFAPLASYDAPSESLTVAPRTELAVWKLRSASPPLWGELGGGPGHAFVDLGTRSVQTAPNDASLAGFTVVPNPARDVVRARIRLTAAARVECRLLTLEGEIVRSASRTGAAGGIVEFEFPTAGLASGPYLARLSLSTGGVRTRPVAVRK